MEKSGFFNAMKTGDTWDRIYKAENFAEYFASFIGNGVFPNPASNLQVKETSKMQVIVQAGKAWINGFIYINTEDLVLDVDVADGVLNRIDKVVLRYDVAKREIRAAIKKGEFNSKPTAPILTRNADMYELALADITISAGAIKISQADITDLRLNKEMCGIVHGIVEQVDTTAIFNQFESWYSTTKDNYDKDISTWTKEKKEAFKEWYSTNTQAFLKQFQTWFKNTEAWEKDFKKWFESIKNILDTNAAGNLLNLINKNTDKIDSIEKNVQSTLEENNKETDKKVQELNSQYEDIANTLETKTTKPDTAIENNIVIFNSIKNLKDSGKSIGNTSGKILELPLKLTTGDMLRVGKSGQIEKLPKGTDGQSLVLNNGLPTWRSNNAWEKIADIELTKSTLTVDFIINKTYDKIILSIYGSNSRFDSNPGASNSPLEVKINNLITLENVGLIRLATYSKYRGYLEVEIPGSCKADNSGKDYKEIYCRRLGSLDNPQFNFLKLNISDYYDSISTLSLSCNQGGFAPYTKIKVLGVLL